MRILILDSDPEVFRLCRLLFSRHQCSHVATLGALPSANELAANDGLLAEWTLPDGKTEDLLLTLSDRAPNVFRVLHAGLRPPDLSRLKERGIVQRFFLKPAWRSLAGFVRQREHQTGQAVTPICTRREPRVPLRIAAMLTLPQKPIPGRVLTTDVSASGLCVCAYEPIPVNTTIHLTLVLPSGTRICGQGQVRHSTAVAKTESAVTFHIGIELDPLP